ncbi:hypothetical protein BDF19DRAFT_428731 [Syncephalis fuscata]|nr:hypothetical protein BDF19DRAFT_428731 [Syncephalis fuscata]
MNSIKILQRDESIRCYSEHHLRGVLQFLGCKQSRTPGIAAAILERTHEYLLRSTSKQENGQNIDYISREVFQQCVQTVLTEWHYHLPESHQQLAWSVRNRERGICILLGGTSGCGKSTLASLLASRLGITTVLSTDNIRNVLRSFISEEDNPVLWASSYHAGESSIDDLEDTRTNEERVIHGYQSQTETIYPQLRETVRRLLGRNESVIIEGVHLSVDVMIRLAKEFSMCLPFVIYINKEAKHAERFATRAKYMTLEPRFNKYMKYFENIRMIQSHLCRKADVHLVPKMDNTNVDQSLAVIHSTMLNVLSRIMNESNIQLVDDTTNATSMLHEEYERMRNNSRNSKAMMLRMIRERPTLGSTSTDPELPVTAIETTAETEAEVTTTTTTTVTAVTSDPLITSNTSTDPSTDTTDNNEQEMSSHEEDDINDTTDIDTSSNGSSRIRDFIHFLDEVDYGSLGS